MRLLRPRDGARPNVTLSPWLRLAFAWAVIAAVAAILLYWPPPVMEEAPHLRTLLVVAGAVMLAGKVLYDTLFWDRLP